MQIALIFSLICSSFTVFGATHTARIIKLENKSEVYVPGEKKEGGFTHIKYLEEIYHIVPAVRGFKLENGHILTTGPQSKAKVIFNNGDHLYIAENTQYKINWKRDTLGPTKDPSVITLMRGAFRGLIKKDGPRSGMKVETKAAVMGVRGTDFHVSEKHGSLNVSVIRGQVELLNKKINQRPIKIESGQILTKKDNSINLAAITKEDLKQIGNESVIENTIDLMKPEQTKELVELEQKATEVSINDIKEYQPQIYQEILKRESESKMTSDSLALNTVEIMEKKAPHKAKKPTRTELENNKDPYDEYKFEKEKE
jgi:hypothetical protein